MGLANGQQDAGMPTRPPRLLLFLSPAPSTYRVVSFSARASPFARHVRLLFPLPPSLEVSMREFFFGCCCCCCCCVLWAHSPPLALYLPPPSPTANGEIGGGVVPHPKPSGAHHLLPLTCPLLAGFVLNNRLVLVCVCVCVCAYEFTVFGLFASASPPPCVRVCIFASAGWCFQASPGEAARRRDTELRSAPPINPCRDTE